MKIAILCETSGTIRELMREKGHDVISCDTLPADDLSPSDGHHWQGDAMKFLQDSDDGEFDLIIGHPPCTALAVSGNRWYGQGMEKHAKRLEAMQWTVDLWNLAKRKAKRVAFENPVGVLGHTEMGKASFYTQPWEHGHPESKRTGFWTWNLPKLKETDNVKDVYDTLPKREQQRLHYLPPSPDRWKIRSKTFMGIAQAIANQWGELD
jgi:hypothetical protein